MGFDVCRVEPVWERDAVTLHIFRENNGVRTLVGPGGDVMFSRVISEYVPGATDDYRPALTISESQARAVVQALTTYFGGAEDSRALRKDYDAERARVDKLTAAVVAIATAARAS